MIPMTPIGTRPCSTLTPSGVCQPRTTSPTGSSSRATPSRPTAIPSTRSGVRVRRSTMASSIPSSRPRSTSARLAARMSSTFLRNPAAMAISRSSLSMRRSRRNTVAADRAALACSMTRELMATWYSSGGHGQHHHGDHSDGESLLGSSTTAQHHGVAMDDLPGRRRAHFRGQPGARTSSHHAHLVMGELSDAASDEPTVRG